MSHMCVCTHAHIPWGTVHWLRRKLCHARETDGVRDHVLLFPLCPLGNQLSYVLGLMSSRLPADSASKQGPIEAIQKSVRLFEERRYREMRRKNIIGQVCDTPKSYDNIMHVGLRKVTFKWQRGNKIGEEAEGCLTRSSSLPSVLWVIRFDVLFLSCV